MHTVFNKLTTYTALTMSGSCGALDPTTVGVAMALICQNISLSEGENRKAFTKVANTTSVEYLAFWFSDT